MKKTIFSIRNKVSKTFIRSPVNWFHHQGLENTDMFVASYPRSGSTWLRFLLYELLVDQDPTFMAVNQAIPDIGHQHKALRLLPNGKRMIKTHEPFRKNYKQAIYLVRDVRDVAISEYYFLRGLGIYSRPLKEFINDFLKGKVNGYGSWTRHVRSWLTAAQNQEKQILIIRYEDLRQEPIPNLNKILLHIGVPTTTEKVKQVIVNNSIKNMRKKEEEYPQNFFKRDQQNNRFIRNGKVNSWQTNLTPQEQSQLEMASCDLLSLLGYELTQPIGK